MFDLLLTGGLVADGSGAPMRVADVGITGDVIVAVGRLEGAEAAREIDARGHCVAPGFIDTHSHSDVALLADPQHAAKVCQGVTTELLGQDGLSYAPLSPANLQSYRRYLAGLNGNPDIAWNWSSVAEFRARFDRTVSINTVYLIPHSTVRFEVLGMRDAPLRGEALNKAKALVAQGMEEGAAGLSTGLSYYPGSYSDTDELVALCDEVSAAGGVYVTHLRTVFRGAYFDPVLEALHIGRTARVPVHISHFHTNPTTVGRVEELMAPIDAAEADGLAVTMETYPYPSGSGWAVMFLPPWAHAGGPDEILARLADREVRHRLVREMPQERTLARIGWNGFVLSHLPSRGNKDVVGLTVAEAARRRGVAGPEDLICTLLLDEGLEVGFCIAPPTAEVWEKMDRDVLQLLSRPDYTVGSDSIFVGDRPHPRTYGCFPRLLGRLRRKYPDTSLESLINRVTALPARTFGLRDRGLVESGKAADLVVFDPDKLDDTATYEHPRSFPVGVEYVFVNGKVAVENGKPTGVMAGRALTPRREPRAGKR